ncbi:MAG: GC-type dockerin domain-anchored protein [Planctomycetota bacterium]
MTPAPRQTIAIPLAMAASIGLCNHASPANPTTLDLQGGYLFGFDTPPMKGDDLTFSLSVGQDERLTILNGSMIGGVFGGWTDSVTYELLVQGELVFGPGFPQDTVYLRDDIWSIQIEGTLRVAEQNPTFVGDFGGTQALRVTTGGELVIESGNHLRLPGAAISGTIRVEPNGRLTCFESCLVGPGTLELAESAVYSGGLSDQRVRMARGSVLSFDLANGPTIELPADGPALVRGFSQGELVNSEIVIPGIPERGDASTIEGADTGNGVIAPLQNSTIRLLSAEGAAIGSESIVLRCRDCDTDDRLDSIELIVPTGPSTLIELRWGTEGLYALGQPDGWCPGDLNFDGAVNFFDLVAFIEFFNADSAWANITGSDQSIDFFDINAYLELFLAACP